MVSLSKIFYIFFFIGCFLGVVGLVMKNILILLYAIFFFSIMISSFIKDNGLTVDSKRFDNLVNLQEYSPDGSSNRFYNFFFQVYLVIFLLPVAFLLMVPIMYITLAFMHILTISNHELPSINFFDSLLNPILIIFITLIISAICIYRPMQRMGTIQNHNQSRNKFKFTRFFSVIIIGFIILFGYSMIFDTILSNTNHNEGTCNICGSHVDYESKVNNKVIYQFCLYHAMGWAFLHPINIIVNPPIHGYGFEDQFSLNDIQILLSALLGILTWVFIIGFAFILGSGYTWNWAKGLSNTAKHG